MSRTRNRRMSAGVLPWSGGGESVEKLPGALAVGNSGVHVLGGKKRGGANLGALLAVLLVGAPCVLEAGAGATAQGIDHALGCAVDGRASVVECQTVIGVGDGGVPIFYGPSEFRRDAGGGLVAEAAKGENVGDYGAQRRGDGGGKEGHETKVAIHQALLAVGAWLILFVAGILLHEVWCPICYETWRFVNPVTKMPWPKLLSDYYTGGHCALFGQCGGVNGLCACATARNDYGWLIVVELVGRDLHNKGAAFKPGVRGAAKVALRVLKAGFAVFREVLRGQQAGPTSATVTEGPEAGWKHVRLALFDDGSDRDPARAQYVYLAMDLIRGEMFVHRPSFSFDLDRLLRGSTGDEGRTMASPGRRAA